MKKILCLILFLSLTSFAFAADINWSLAGTASENLIVYTSTSGNISDIKDNNEATSRYVEFFTLAGGSYSPEWKHEVAFVETVLTINKVEVVSTAVANNGAVTSFRIYLYYSGTWHLVYTGGTGTWAKRTESQTGTWNNVSKIRLHIVGSCSNQQGAPQGVGTHLWELRAWGPLNYTDIGLRVRTSSGTIKIGVQDLDGHKLRIRKGGTTYGIPLLATNDSDASGVRIYDGSVVKALPKVD